MFKQKEINAVFEPYDLMLTAAVGVGFETAYKAYDIPAISKYTLFIYSNYIRKFLININY